MTDQEPGDPPDDATVGVVLAGGGARGAYEAGMLATLLPTLAEFRQRPEAFVGTSAGALNAVLFASLAHLPAQQAADEALRAWRRLTKDQVLAPFLPAVPALLRQYLAALFDPGRPPVSGLLDTRPLRETLRTKLDWRQLHANMLSGTVQAVAVATTSCSSGRTEIFVEGPRAADLPESDVDRAVDYSRTVLTEEHVLASAAIPVAFPPVYLAEADGWYMDGGVRLNAPIKPVISLGARRVVIVATTPLRYLPRAHGPGGPAPAVADVVAQVLNGVLADRMIEDTRTLGKVDELLRSGGRGRSPGGRPYEVIEYLFGGPPPGQGDRLGERAAYVLDTYFRGIRRLSDLDLAVLSFLLGPGHSRGELLSYLLFQPEFIDEAIRLGQRDAQLILDTVGDDPNKLWRNDAC
ncbi:patatin-like phospholipase family protein [Streptomyces niger]|uniref:patatin-like phospholipase family protein n=1 Tax=Streptomyces niger TaxID=66373 RepID=UPI0018FEB634|nr:patatin-like phospholipase family protein [Streptomyces niger]